MGKTKYVYLFGNRTAEGNSTAIDYSWLSSQMDL